MPDHNTPPGQLTVSNFGRIIRHRDGHDDIYQITPIDYCYLAYASHHEEQNYPWLVQWAIAQRWAGYMRLWRVGQRPTASWKRAMELYCAPLNPTFAFTGDVSRQSPSRLPPPGPVCTIVQPPEPIPGIPSPRRWREVVSAGAGGPHNNDGRGGTRQSRFVSIRKSLGMLGTSQMNEWISSGHGPSERARRAAWMMCRGQMGNPIPGIDNWDAIPNIDAFTPNYTILPELSDSERATALATAQRGTRSRPLYFILGSGRTDRVGVRAYKGRTNRYQYRSFMTRGSITIEFTDSDNNFYSSDRSPIEYGHYRNGQSTLNNSVSPVSDNARRVASHMLDRAEQGSPPINQPHISAEEVTQNFVPQGMNRVDIRLERRETALGPYEEIWGSVEEWATQVENELTDQFGRN